MRRDCTTEDAVIYELVRPARTPTGEAGQWFEVVPTEGDLALVHAGPGAPDTENHDTYVGSRGGGPAAGRPGL